MESSSIQYASFNGVDYMISGGVVFQKKDDDWYRLPSGSYNIVNNELHIVSKVDVNSFPTDPSEDEENVCISCQ